MSFNLANLSALSYSNGFTLWHYRTTDILIGDHIDNYWAPAYKLVRPGDFIFCNTGLNTENKSHYILVVVSICEEHKTVSVVSTCGIREITEVQTIQDSSAPLN